MDYVGQIFRPPSEAHSLLVQVTVGCSHNRCTFCAMYRAKTFQVKPLDVVLGDIEEARRFALAQHGPPERAFERVFLCDGDVLTLSVRRLLPILEAIRTRLPWVARVGVYGDTRGVGAKSVAELKTLREAGLSIVYHGLESGDDEVLQRIEKGGTRAEALAMAEKLRAAGLTHSVIVLLGIGGVELSERHAHATASALTAMDPAYVGALATMVLPGTPLGDLLEAGRFTLPDKFQMVAELRTIVAEADLTHARFSANHASNYLPLRGNLPADRAALLATLDRVLAARDESLLKPEFLRGL
jgi:radical SAM superfamily enzyme YgiQ (UPF0313 family)